MIFQALQEAEVNLFEYAFLMGDEYHTASQFLMRIPKLMPLMLQGRPFSSVVNFNNNLFVNDASCKPSTDNSIVIQNYLRVPRFANTNFQHKADIYGIIHDGARFIACIMDGNPRDIHLTDNI